MHPSALPSYSSAWRWTGRPALLGALALLLLVCHLPTAYGLLPAADDPLPFRRVPITSDRLPAEMERVKQGVLVQLPRREFEERVRRAAQAGESVRNPPRLIEAQYRARLTAAGLVGTGQWKVLNPGPAAGVLPLQPLNLALRQPRVDNHDAVIADFDGKAPGLLVEQSGEHAVTLDWTARGEPRPGGLHFDLEVPACPITSLELNLPREAVLAISSDGGVLSGPLPAETDDRRLWRIGFARRAQLRLTVRRPDEAGQPRALVLARQQTTQTLTPDFLQADFTFDLKVQHQAVRELRCALAPGLRPYEVLIPGLEGWELLASSGHVLGGPASWPRTLRIRLREPFQGGALQVRCYASLPGGDRPGLWHCPGVRVTGSAADVAVSRGEELVLRVHPDVSLQSWEPGNFRLVKSATQTEKDGTLYQVLTLTGGGLDGAATERFHGNERPSARLQAAGVDYRARQLTSWEVGAEQMLVKTQITYEVSRGQLTQFAVQVPAGWDVERVETGPPDLLADWRLRQEAGRSVLLVDLPRTLKASPSAARGDEPRVGPPQEDARAASAALRLNLWLRRPFPRPDGPEPGVTLPFPEVLPLGARWQEGALAVVFDEKVLEGTVVSNVAPLAVPGEEGPWGKTAVNKYLPYEGAGLHGTLTLRPRPTRLRAACTSEVFLASGRAAVQLRLTLKAEVGSPDAVDLYLSAPVASKWEARDWKVEGHRNEVRRCELLAAGGEPGPLGPARWLLAAAGQCALGGPPGSHLPWPSGQYWRLRLAQPLSTQQPLTLTCDVQATVRDGRCQVPLVAVLGTARMDGEVKLFLAGADVVQVEAEGLREQQAPAGARAGGASPWRTFRYGQPPAALALRGLAPATDRTAEAGAGQVVLTTYVEPSGRLLHHYRFQLWSRGLRPLPLTLRLPDGARVLAARVDGRWINHLTAPRTGEGTLELPVPSGSPLHSYQVVYSTEGFAWRLWEQLAAPAPELSVHTVGFRQTWFLPPGVVPLDRGGYRPLPGSGSGPRDDLDDGLPALSFLFHGWSTVDWKAEQTKRFTEASDAVLTRGSAGKGLTLREVLDRLEFEQLREQTRLVLDATALSEAGLRPEAPLPSTAGVSGSWWEGLGLMLIPCRAAPLLTTHRQWETWCAAASGTPTVPSVLAEAVAEAALHGQDSSGRFHSAADWLRRSDAGRPRAEAGETEPGVGLLPTTFGADWTEWEALAGAAPGEDLVVVRKDGLAPVGLTLAALLGLIFWRLGGPVRGPQGRGMRWRGRLVFLLAWLALSGLAFVWLPATLRGLTTWPLLASCLAGIGWYLWSAALIRGRPAPSGRHSGVKPLVALLLGISLPAAWLLHSVARSGEEAPAALPIVFIVPGAGKAPDQESVLAPPELLDQLDRLAQRGAGEPRGAVLLSGRYEGKVTDGSAAFKAVFQVHCFSDERVSLLLPLAGIKLEDEVFLDGARAFPVAARPARVGYTLPVKGRGGHVVELHFSLDVRSAGVERSFECTVPGLLQSQLTLDLPAGARAPQARVGVRTVPGIQQVTNTPEGAQLTADLGRLTSPLQIAWRQEGSQPGAAHVEVKEAYLWDLRADSGRWEQRAERVDGSSLTAALHYHVKQGTIPALLLDVPRGLEVQSVEAQTLPDGAALPLRDWRLYRGAEPHSLRLEFQGQVAGEILLTLQMVRNHPLAPDAELLLPMPRGVTSTERVLAYLLDGLEVKGAELHQAVTLDRRKFALLWRNAGQVRPADWLPGQAYSFRRQAGPAAPVRLHLQVQPPRVQATQDIAWRIGPEQADVQLTARLTAAPEDLSLVEWQVPAAVQIVRVTGRDVRSWSRSGEQVQVWLDHAPSSTKVTLAGWQSLPAGTAQFTLPAIRLTTTPAQSNKVWLTASRGLTLKPQRVWQMQPPAGARVPPPAEGSAEWIYETRQPQFGGVFQLDRSATQVEVHSLVFAETAEQKLTFTATLDCRARQGELRTVTVRLHNWVGAVGRPEGPQVAQSLEGPPDPLGPSWIVELKPDTSNHCRLTLSGSLPLDQATGGVGMPEVSLDGAEPQWLQRWLAIGGPELLAQDAQGLAPVPIQELQATWPREAERLRKVGGSVWKIASDGKIKNDDWNLAMQPRVRSADSAPVRVFLTEHVATVVDGRRWAHEATYWLYHAASTDLSFQLPAGVRVLAVAVDGAMVTPLQPGPGRLWLPLPGGAGALRVRLRWLLEASQEELQAPSLVMPRLEGAAEGASTWCVNVPAGYQVVETGKAATGAARRIGAAGLELRRAAAQLQLARVLAPLVREGNSFEPQFAAVQQRFASACRYADYWLTMPDTHAAEPRANDQSLADWLQELKKENRTLTQTPTLEKLRTDAEHDSQAQTAPDTSTRSEPGPPGAPAAAPLAALPERGTPVYWQAGVEGTPPSVQLIAPRTQHARAALATSLLLGVLLLAIALLAMIRPLGTWVRAFWPEQLLVLAGLAWREWGLSPGVVLLLLLGVGVRVVFLARHGLDLLRRYQAAGAAGSSVTPT